MKTIIIDPGHGMSNRQPGVYDSGATSSGHSEAAIVMDWANELRDILKARGMKVVLDGVFNHVGEFGVALPACDALAHDGAFIGRRQP